MRAVRWWNSETRRYPAAAAVGLMWALAYPTPGVAGLAWVAPGLLLLSGLGLGGASAFRVGYVAGLVQAMVSLRWLLEIPHAAGAVAGWLAMCAWQISCAQNAQTKKLVVIKTAVSNSSLKNAPSIIEYSM